MGTDNALAGGLGFEPRLMESESIVLPLDDPPACEAGFTNSLWDRCQGAFTGFRPGANYSSGLSSARNLRDRRKTTTLRGGRMMELLVWGLRPLRARLS